MHIHILYIKQGAVYDYELCDVILTVCTTFTVITYVTFLWSKKYKNEGVTSSIFFAEKEQEIKM
jgi:hypothetical protein